MRCRLVPGDLLVSNAPVKHERRELDAPDGTCLRVEQWTPAGEVRFVVAIVHGNFEHVGRYADEAMDLCAKGGLVFGLDHRGQGESSGVRGHVESFDEYSLDLRHVLLDFAGQCPPQQRPDQMPWFLFAHSMGGLIALGYLLDHVEDVALRGAIISSPLLGLAVKVNPIKLLVGKLAATLMPKLSLPSEIPAAAICRDEAEVARYEADPRRTRVVTAAWFAAMKRAIERVDRDVSKLTLPLLWYYGTGDLICDHTASERIAGKLVNTKSNDQTLRGFEGYFHELHNEPATLRRPVIEMVQSWIEARV